MQRPVIAAVVVALALLAARPAGAVPLRAGADAALSAVDSDSPPWFCHNLDCPKYDVLEVKDAYETRYYKVGEGRASPAGLQLFLPAGQAGRFGLPVLRRLPGTSWPQQLRTAHHTPQPGMWASTDVQSYAFSMAVSTGFKR